MRDLFGEESRAFYKFGSWRQLPPISTGEWRAGLANRFKEGGQKVTDVALRSLLSQSEGHTRRQCS
jgi:hypothetical protein